MRYTPLSPALLATNRHNLIKSLPKDSLAVIDTADILKRPGDFEHPFRPDSNFYYLTGFDESEAVLLLAPTHPHKRLREVLFIRPTSDFTALWEGKRLTSSQATKRSGIQTVLSLGELDNVLSRVLPHVGTIYFNTEATLEPGPLGPSDRRALAWRTQLPTHELKSLTPYVDRLRTIKADEEINQIRAAIALTGHGLTAAWAALKPGVPEYVLAAEFTAEIMRRGATGSAFSPIVASGANSTVIHYAPDMDKVKPGDLVLFDVGAEAGYYAADISRTVPEGLQFNDRQRAVYLAVRRAQAAGLAAHRPGATILSVDETMRRVLLEETVKLGLLTKAETTGPDARDLLHEYYPHISHHLGLGTHDTGTAELEFVPGMVVTCEPGLYLQEEGIGVRLEDVVLITPDGHEVLSSAVPYAA